MTRFDKFCRLVGQGNDDLKNKFALQLGVPKVFSPQSPTEIKQI